MKTQAPALNWFTTQRGRSVYIDASELPAENDKENKVAAIIESAPSFPALLKAYDRFRRDLNKYDYNPAVIRRQPWDLLTAHAGVMSAKSARAQTLLRLAASVFSETGLPRKPRDGFRGSDGLDWDNV